MPPRWRFGYSGAPYVVGQMNSSASTGLVAYDFNISRGQWQYQTLGSNVISLATIAADSKGGVGAAWVQNSQNGPTLMYAYNDGTHNWVTETVTTSACGLPVDQQEKVGLAFDANNFPVISFLAGPNSICLAYDPLWHQYPSHPPLSCWRLRRWPSPHAFGAGGGPVEGELTNLLLSKLKRLAQ